MSRPQVYRIAGTVLALLVANTALAKGIPVHDVSVAGMEARIVRLERLLNPGHQLQLYQQLTTLQQELEGLRGSVERSQHRLQLLEQQLKSLAATPQPGKGKNAAANQPSIVDPPERSDKLSLPGEQSERTAYEQALQAVNSSPAPAPEALQRLEQFIKDYPKSSYLPNAYYWLGQLLFKQKEFSRASHYFARVLQAFPKSAKCSDAMLKIGFITQTQGDTAKAKAIYQRVVQQYPSSSSAEQAKTRLSKLK